MGKQSGFHFGGREFQPFEIKQVLLEKINPEGNFFIPAKVPGFVLHDGTILINGKSLSGAMCASFRSHFNAEQVFIEGKWVFIPDKPGEQSDGLTETG